MMGIARRWSTVGMDEWFQDAGVQDTAGSLWGRITGRVGGHGTADKVLKYILTYRHAYFPNLEILFKISFLNTEFLIYHSLFEV